MKLLILTFYYEPDLCAGSFRATALVRALSERLGPDDRIDIMTTVPNRYHSFRAGLDVDESHGNIHVRRFELPRHRSGMVDQSLAYLAYARAVLRAVRDQRYDMVFATSARLMTAALGARVARRQNAPLYLDIRDIFTDALADVFAGKPQAVLLPLFRRIEAGTVRRAERINLVSPGFVDYYRGLRDMEYRVFTNGIDEEFLAVDYRQPVDRDGRRVILYVGNIGEGQGLERLVPNLAARLPGPWEIWIVGDGGTRLQLEQRLRDKPAGDIRLIDPVPRQELLDYYRRADVLFLHLNDYPAFHRVLPSKVFEYAATGKPILAGVDGFARRFITDNIANAAVFDPCDAAGFLDGLKALRLEPTAREDFIERYDRRSIMNRMADDILATLR